MKKTIAIFTLILLLVTMSWAGDVRQSAQFGKDMCVATGDGLFHGIIVMTDGTYYASVDIYDNTATSGAKLIPTWDISTNSTDRSRTLSINPPARYYKGVYVDITTSGTIKYMVYKEDR